MTDSALPDTPVGVAVAWFIDALAAQTLDEDGVRARFSDEMLQAFPASTFVASAPQFAWFAQAEHADVEPSSDHELEMVLTVDDEPRLVLRAAVEPQEPHRFTMLALQPPGPSVLEILDGATPFDGPIAEAVAAMFHPVASKLSNGGVVVGVSRAGEREFSSFGGALELRYDIGSITKTFTGLLLADMVYRGEVTLEDTLQSHLPDVVTVPRDENEILLTHLSTHTSGLPRLPPNMFEGSQDADPYAHIDVPRLYAELNATALTNPIGTVCEYSNYAQASLGHALGLVAGRPYADLVLGRICRPLGMKESGFDGTNVIGAFAGGVAVPRWTGEVFQGAGIGMSCTVADLLTYAEAAADPLQTPLAEAFNVALSSRTNIESPAGPRSEQGLGWIRIGLLDGSCVYFHNGGTGGFRSAMVVHAPTRICVVALCNEAEVDSGLDQAAFALIGALTNEGRTRS